MLRAHKLCTNLLVLKLLFLVYRKLEKKEPNIHKEITCYYARMRRLIKGVYVSYSLFPQGQLYYPSTLEQYF